MQADNRTTAALALGVLAILAFAASCAPATPRGSAYQGVPLGADQPRAAQNSPYYQGSDPDYPRGRRSSP